MDAPLHDRIDASDLLQVGFLHVAKRMKGSLMGT